MPAPTPAPARRPRQPSPQRPRQNWWVGAGGDGDYAESRANAKRALNEKLIELEMLDPPTPAQDNDEWWTTSHALQHRWRNK